jgi:protein TonB
MSLVAVHRSRGSRMAELTLWSSAAALILSAHVGLAALMMQEDPESPAENAPPAAIMIDLAPEPVAANTQEDQVAPDTADAEEVKSEETQPVEDPPPIEQPTPEPEPAPDPVAEAPPEPVEPPPEVAEETPEPEPAPPEVAELPPEPTPEPVEKVDPIEEQVTAALENVEVPLPTMRPPPPEKLAEAKPRPKDDAKKIQRAKQQQRQAQKEMAEAKLQTEQAERTAATQTTSGSTMSSVTPARWKSRVQAKLARNARRCPGSGTGTAAVRFKFDGDGNVTGISLSRSSGDPAIDDYIVSAVRRASPIPAPPSGVASYLDQALTCTH